MVLEHSATPSPSRSLDSLSISFILNVLSNKTCRLLCRLAHRQQLPSSFFHPGMKGWLLQQISIRYIWKLYWAIPSPWPPWPPWPYHQRVTPNPICRFTLLEQYTDAPSQTHLRYAHHCHMEYWRQTLPQCLQPKLAERARQRNSWGKVGNQ